MNGRVLIIAGSDSGGGAGIQADIKTVTALGGFAATAVTALTAQNTLGVSAIHPIPPGFVARQMEEVLEDLGADCLKTGMLGGAATIEAVIAVIDRLAHGVPLVVDPVMVAKGGAALLAEESVPSLGGLLRRASVITPNVPEAAALLGCPITNNRAQTEAARELLELGCGAVLLKGGHLDGDEVVDVLVTRSGVQTFAASRIVSRSTHGTGCTLASAIAVGLAQKMDLSEAVVRARAYVRRAIETAPGYGTGHGPLNHGHTAAAFDDW